MISHSDAFSLDAYWHVLLKKYGKLYTGEVRKVNEQQSTLRARLQRKALMAWTGQWKNIFRKGIMQAGFR